MSKLMLLLGGLLVLALGTVGFFFLLLRGAESILVYPAAACMYVGLGLTLYAMLMFWTDLES